MSSDNGLSSLFEYKNATGIAIKNKINGDMVNGANESILNEYLPVLIVNTITVKSMQTVNIDKKISLVISKAFFGLKLSVFIG